MKQIEKHKFYKIYMAWNRIRNGLFLFTLINFLNRLGLDFDLYYWDQEGLDLSTDEIKIRDSKKRYEVVNIEADEIGIMNNIMGLDSVKLKEDIIDGQMCMGLKHQNEIVAVVFAKFNDFIHKDRVFKLESNQAYIFNLYTFEDYRGKNLAPFLRHQSYVALKERDVDEIFCITSFFNKSSINSNKKLGIKHLKLFLHIGLFKRFHWNYELKSY